MANDFRILVGFSDNRKTKKLVAVMGEGAIRQLLRLFEFTRENRPKGVLLELDRAAIGEIASGCVIGHDITQQDAEGITDAFHTAGFLDLKRNGSYEVHDWREINPYGFFSKERKKQAQKAAKTRWLKKHNGLDPCSQHELALLNDANSNAPTPTPTPTPKSKSAAETAPTPAPSKVLKKVIETNQQKSEMRQVTDHWMDSYAATAKERGWQIEKYDFARGKDGKIMAELIRKFGAGTVIAMVTAFFTSDDEWITQRGGFTVGVFKSQFNKLAQQQSTAEQDPNRKEYVGLYAAFLKEGGHHGPFDVGRFLEFCRAHNAPDKVMELIDRELGTTQNIGTGAA